MVFLTAAWQRQILVVDLEALLRNETGFQPAEQTVDGDALAVSTGTWNPEQKAIAKQWVREIRVE